VTTELELHVEDHPGYRILEVAGEVDMSSSISLRDELRKSLNGTRVLKVDLSGVHYLDSSGIAVLIQGFKWARRKEIEYRLLDPSKQVTDVIKLAMLQTFFTIEKSREDG